MARTARVEQEGTIEAANLAREVATIASEALASDILVLDIQGVSTIADYFVIGTTDNVRHLRATADTITQKLREEGSRPDRIEGTPDSGWILLDYNAVIIHLFTVEQRAFYRLEELWSDAQRLLVIQ